MCPSAANNITLPIKPAKAGQEVDGEGRSIGSKIKLKKNFEAKFLEKKSDNSFVLEDNFEQKLAENDDLTYSEENYSSARSRQQDHFDEIDSDTGSQVPLNVSFDLNPSSNPENLYFDYEKFLNSDSNSNDQQQQNHYEVEILDQKINDFYESNKELLAYDKHFQCFSSKYSFKNLNCWYSKKWTMNDGSNNTEADFSQRYKFHLSGQG